MSKHHARLTFMAIAAMGLAAPLCAQGRSTVSSADLDAAVALRPAVNRVAVPRFLTSNETPKVVAPAAERAKGGERTLAGGSEKVVISTTAIIIGLLILILLVR